jgi:hypothetical protein
MRPAVRPMYRIRCPSCGSRHAYIRRYRGSGLSRYVVAPLGLLCIAGMLVGALAYVAQDTLMLEAARIEILADMGIASLLLLALLILAEIHARRSTTEEGFCGSCGDPWKKTSNQSGNDRYRGILIRGPVTRTETEKVVGTSRRGRTQAFGAPEAEIPGASCSDEIGDGGGRHPGGRGFVPPSG